MLEKPFLSSRAGDIAGPAVSLAVGEGKHPIKYSNGY